MYKNQDRLSIIDPNNPENDISGGSGGIESITAAFRDAFKKLQREMATLARDPRPFGSILKPIFGGDYSSFIVQRAHLERLANR